MGEKAVGVEVMRDGRDVICGRSVVMSEVNGRVLAIDVADLRTAGAIVRDLKSPASGVRRGIVDLIAENWSKDMQRYHQLVMTCFNPS